MSWVFLSIAAASVWAVVNIVDKYMLSRLSIKPFVPVFVSCLIGFLGSIFIFAARGFVPMSTGQMLLALFVGALYVAMLLLYMHAVRLDEISRVAPLFYLSPIFVSVIAAFSLGEIFTPLKYVGIALLVSGAVLISLKDFFSFRFNHVFYLMLLAALALAINEVITKYLLSITDFWHVFAYIRLGAFLTLLPVLYLHLSDIRAWYSRADGLKAMSIVSANEALSLFGVFLITIAASIGYITFVNALASVQPFFVLLFTVLISMFLPHILEEEIGKKAVFIKFVAIVCIFVGALIIS